MPKLVTKLEKYLDASAEQANGSQQQAHGMGLEAGKNPEQLFHAKKWFADHDDGSGGSATNENEATGDGVTTNPTLKRYPKSRGGVLAGCRSLILTGASTQLQATRTLSRQATTNEKLHTQRLSFF